MSEDNRPDLSALQDLDAALEIFDAVKEFDPKMAAHVASEMTSKVIKDTHDLLLKAINKTDLTYEDAIAAMAKSAGSLFALARMLDIEVEDPRYPKREKP